MVYLALYFRVRAIAGVCLRILHSDRGGLRGFALDSEKPSALVEAGELNCKPLLKNT